MLRRLLSRREFILGGLFPVIEEYDIEEFKKRQGVYIEDPWKRVKTIFSKDDYGNLHPEMVNVIQSGQLGLLVGACVGGFPESIKETKKFLEENDARVFFGKKEANRTLIRHSSLGFFKGTLRVAPKYGIFFALFTLISSATEVYRNKSGIIEYMLSGLTVGALFRFSLGPKGMLSGGIVGLGLGTIYGCFTWMILVLTGHDRLQIKYAQFAMAEHARNKAQKRIKGGEPIEGLETAINQHVKNPLENYPVDDEA